MSTDTPARLPAATLFIFGAHGDLAQRQLMPALYRLCRVGLMGAQIEIVGIDHNEATDESFRQRLEKALQALARDPDAEGGGEPLDDACWRGFTPCIHYQRGDFLASDTYQKIAERLRDRPGNAIFYLGTAPRFFGSIVAHLGQAGLLHESNTAFRRVAVEKPFGTDLSNARELNACLAEHLEESQLYRVDHFAGKDAARNLSVHRFANGLVESFWDRHHIDHVQISALETLGVEGRSRFYEHTGALRDMVPNHLLQLLALVAMEPPRGPAPQAWRAEKARVLGAIRRAGPTQATHEGVRGQYVAGNGKGYREEAGIAADSSVETFVALKLGVDTPRWQGVPFYLRTGKRMSRRATEIVVAFKPPARAGGFDPAAPVRAVLRVDPGERLTLHWPLRRPGPDVHMENIPLHLAAADTFRAPSGSGYETVLYHLIAGNQSFFQAADEVEASWAAVEPFQQAWRQGSPDPYPAGSDGPKASQDLIVRDGRAWQEAEP